MSQTPTRDAKLIRYLNEAYAKERQLEAALAAHAEVTTHDDYALRVRDHRIQTRAHAEQVAQRIKQLGGTPEAVPVGGHDGLAQAAESVVGMFGKAMAAAKGSLDSVRRLGEQERMLRNARTEYQEEAYEIAMYTAIEALALTAGDADTAQLAQSILAEERAMQDFLARMLPEIAAAVVHDEIPISEIETAPPARKKSAARKPAARKKAAAKKKSGARKKAAAKKS
jgi:ferritin-like metal-binding protein YciE